MSMQLLIFNVLITFKILYVLDTYRYIYIYVYLDKIITKFLIYLRISMYGLRRQIKQ